MQYSEVLLRDAIPFTSWSPAGPFSERPSRRMKYACRHGYLVRIRSQRRTPASTNLEGDQRVTGPCYLSMLAAVNEVALWNWSEKPEFQPQGAAPRRSNLKCVKGCRHRAPSYKESASYLRHEWLSKSKPMDWDYRFLAPFPVSSNEFLPTTMESTFVWRNHTPFYKETAFHLKHQ